MPSMPSDLIDDGVRDQPADLLERPVVGDGALDDEVGAFGAGAGLRGESGADPLEQGE